MRNSGLLVIALFSITTLLAQDNQPYGYYLDALRFSQTYTGGTARIQGLGGSFIALGADATTIGDNPAGLGLFNRSVFSVTGGFSHRIVGASTNNQHTDWQRFYGNFENLALIWHQPAPGTKGWLGGAIGIGLNRINDFNNVFRYKNRQNQNSLIDYFIESANGLPAGNMPYLDEATSLTALAYHTYLIGPWDVIDSNYPDDEYFSDITTYFRPELLQEETVTTRGGQYQISLAYGGNLADMLYLGLSLNLLTLHYEEHKIYTEREYDYSADDPAYAPLNSLRVEEQLDISGTGFRASFGLIFRPAPFLRIGAALSTPSYYNLDDRYSASLAADWNNFYYQDLAGGDTVLNYLAAYTVPVASRYSLYTPFKVSAGVALIMGKVGFFSLDAEYLDYRKGWLGSNNLDMEADNEYIRNNFYQALNLKSGIELRLNTVRLRVGYALYQVPLDASPDYLPANQRLSAGAGIRLKKFYADLALVNHQLATSYIPYTLEDGSQPLVNINQNNFNVLLTLGFRF